MPFDFIRKFNPHEMSDESVKSLATGREGLAADVLQIIHDNQRSSSSNRHVMLTGARGMGKSFFLRMIQVKLQECSPEIPFVLLPEELYNVHSFSGMLREIRRVLSGTKERGSIRYSEKMQDDYKGTKLTNSVTLSLLIKVP